MAAKSTTLLITLLLQAIDTCRAGDPVDVTDFGKVRYHTFTEQETAQARQGLDEYAKSSGLDPLRDDRNDETRIWVTWANFDVHTIGYSTIGYIIGGTTVRTCRITYPRKHRSPFHGTCKIDRRLSIRVTNLPAMSALAALSGNSLGCGVMDGAWVEIDGIYAARRFQLDANNPDSCTDSGSKLVAEFLSELGGNKAIASTTP
jgi:hypothetical protein